MPVETKEDALKALKTFLGIEEEISVDIRGPYGSFDGAYFTGAHDGNNYNIFKSDGRVEKA